LVLSSADAVATLIRQGERVAMIGGEGLREALTRAGARIVRGRRAETAVVGLDFKLTYAKVARVCEAVRGGARFVATNADPTYPLEGGRLVPGTGALVAMVREATGVSPLVAGKPSEVAARLVRERFGEVAVVIGDRPATDGAFARSLGAKFVLVGTGVWPTAQAQNEKVADAVAADLLDAWQAVVAKGWI
jgi:glycerol 3-phosphatase-2